MFQTLCIMKLACLIRSGDVTVSLTLHSTALINAITENAARLKMQIFIDIILTHYYFRLLSETT